jgi:hypothetical protein
MANTAPTASTRTLIILDKPADWHEWYAIVRTKAREAHISEQVDLDATTAPAALVAPRQPLYSDVKAGATRSNELTDRERDMFKLDFGLYQEQCVSFRRKEAALVEISNYIFSTVTRTNLAFIIDEKTPWKMLSILKLRIAPTDRARKLELARQYQELKKAPRNNQIDPWLSRWETTYKEAEKLALPDVQEDRATYDFLQAVKSLDSNYAVTHEIFISEKIKKNEALPSVHEAVADFRNYLCLNRASSKTSSRSTFATWNGEPQSKPGEAQNTRKSAKKDGPWTKPCLCGEIHRWSSCSYIVEQLRKPGWTGDSDIQKEIDDKLSKNARLRHFVEIARKQALKKLETSKQKKQPPTKQKDGQPSLDEHLLSPLEAFAAGKLMYKLQNCWTLDSAADIHVCNDVSRFKFEKTAEEEALFAGKEAYKIQAYGTVDLAVRTPNGIARIVLLNVALVPGFPTNLVALRRFTEKGVHWDTQKRHLHRNGKTFCYVDSVDDHWVLE